MNDMQIELCNLAHFYKVRTILLYTSRPFIWCLPNFPCQFICPSIYQSLNVNLICALRQQSPRSRPQCFAF